jgi:hypothetical protein
LFFAASSLLYLGGPVQRLADSPLYFLAFTVAMLTLITVLNVVGLNTGKWLNNLGAFGVLIPALILVALGITSFLRSAPQRISRGVRRAKAGHEEFHFLLDDFLRPRQM